MSFLWRRYAIALADRDPAATIPAQGDPAFEAYKAWNAEHRTQDYKTRAQELLTISAEWVAKWPNSQFAWYQRRDALVSLRSHSAELWKQTGENLMRLSPPHTIASSTAYDWVAAGVNIKEAEALLASELQWMDARPKPARPAAPTLADLVDEANFSSRPFPALCTLAQAQIQLKEFDQAHATIERVHDWLNGDFKRYFDQDPLEAFPDYGAKYFQLSADLAEAQGKPLDALAFYQRVMTNPNYRREYSYAKDLRALWTDAGGSNEAWLAFSEIPPLPPGVPAGRSGAPFLPWLAVDYKRRR